MPRRHEEVDGQQVESSKKRKDLTQRTRRSQEDAWLVGGEERRCGSLRKCPLGPVSPRNLMKICSTLSKAVLATLTPLISARLALLVFFDLGDFVESALVAAAEVGSGHGRFAPLRGRLRR